MARVALRIGARWLAAAIGGLVAAGFPLAVLAARVRPAEATVSAAIPLVAALQLLVARAPGCAEQTRIVAPGWRRQEVVLSCPGRRAPGRGRAL